MNPAIQSVAKRAAKSYHRRARWLELDELEQVALIAGLRAVSAWDSARNPSLEAFAWTVMKNDMATYTSRAGAGLVRGAVCVPLEGVDVETREHGPEGLYATAQRGEQLHRRFLRAARKAKALSLLLSIASGKTLDQFLTESGISKKQYTIMRQKLVYHAKHDPQLKRLWEEGDNDAQSI